MNPNEQSTLKLIGRAIAKLFGWNIQEKERAMSAWDLSDRIYDAVWDTIPGASCHDFYVQDDGAMYALIGYQGKLWRAAVTVRGNAIILGDLEEVTQEFVPVTRTRIIRTAEGQTRWLSVAATAAINRVGEIDSKGLFDSFIRHAEETGEYPIRQFFHAGEPFRTGQADFLARSGNCYITSGVYDDTALARAEIAAIEREPEYWGESIGYAPTSGAIFAIINDIPIPVYRSGINTEISVLPENQAANLFTRTTEVRRMLNDKQMEALVRMFGSQEAAEAWLAENPDAINRQIQEAGMITRSVDVDALAGLIRAGDLIGAKALLDQAETPPATEGVEIEVAEEYAIDDEVIGAVVDRTLQADIFRQMNESLERIDQALTGLIGQQEKISQAQQALAGRVATLELGDTEKRRQWLADQPSRPVVGRVRYQPRQKEGQDPTESNKTMADLATETLNGIGLNY